MQRKLMIAGGVFAALVILSVAGFLAWRGGRAGSTGLVVRLSTSQETFRLGEPMRFSVAVVNLSLKSVSRSFSIYGHRIFEIKGPDGALAPYVVGICQICGEDEELEPLQGLMVRNASDILDEYAIRKEGEYTIRVLELAEDLPASNELRFTVAGGSPPVVDGILDKIDEVLPEGWKAGQCSYKFEKWAPPGRKDAGTIVIQITRRYTHKNRIDMYFTREEAPENPDRDPEVKLCRFLGKNSLGCFYFKVWKETDKTWPTYEEDLRKALGLK